MIFVDTGWLLGLINPADQHRRASTAALRDVTGPLLTTSYVLVELWNGCSQPKLRQSCGKTLDALVGNVRLEVVHVSPHLHAVGLDLYRARPDKAWSLTDCVSFVLMRERGVWEALAFDAHFGQAGFVPLLRDA